MCDQCGTRTRELRETDWGLLCLRCGYRQSQRDIGAGLGPTTFGFPHGDLAGYDDDF